MCNMAWGSPKGLPRQGLPRGGEIKSKNESKMRKYRGASPLPLKPNNSNTQAKEVGRGVTASLNSLIPLKEGKGQGEGVGYFLWG